MKYKVLAVLGVLSLLSGYYLVKGAREYRVTCMRSESAFLPVCHVGEYVLGIPNGRGKTVGEITRLANYGKETRQFFLMQRLNASKSAPINLNKVRANLPADSEQMASLNRLAEFFHEGDEPRVDVALTNDAGSVPFGLVMLVTGFILIWLSRRERNRSA